MNMLRTVHPVKGFTLKNVKMSNQFHVGSVQATKDNAKKPSLQLLEKRRRGKVVHPLNVILNGVPYGCPGVAIVSLHYITLNLSADTPYSLQSARIDGVVAKATAT